MREPSRRLGFYFPPPLVGLVVLLTVLILVTPDLISSAAPAAGSLLSQAELIVDWAGSTNLTHLYVRGIGTVRYAQIHLALSPNYNWSNPKPTSNLTWNWTNGTDVVSVSASTGSVALGVNVTALYIDSFGHSVEYGAIYAFTIVGGTLFSRNLSPGGGAPSSVPTSVLPLALLLPSIPVGSNP